jgi:hypothetical protein
MRESITAFKKLGKSLVGVEIGVWRGENALSILQNTDIYLLYLVDPYERYEEYNINEIIGQPNMEENEAHARKILEPYKDQIIWVKRKAQDALEYIPWDVDFVYIDGNHKPEYLKREMEGYYAKIREGGVLAGHDFQKNELRKEVLEFSSKKEHDLWSFPFEEANVMIDWEEEWRLYKVPSSRISVDQEDWWMVLTI